jgi:hypothetical protein
MFVSLAACVVMMITGYYCQTLMHDGWKVVFGAVKIGTCFAPPEKLPAES